MAVQPWFVAALILAPALLGACSGGDDPEPTPNSTAEETATATSTPTPTTSGTATPTATSTVTEEPSHPNAAVWLIEVASGELRVLYEGPDYPSIPRWDEDGRVSVRLPDADEPTRFDLEGNELGAEPPTPAVCLRRAGADPPLVEVGGEEIEGRCGPVSPDGARLLIEVDIESPGVPQGAYAAWVIDLESGERTLVTDELRHCGGCDLRAGPSWSPSGRFLLIGETYGGDDSAVYLFDAEDGTTRQVAEGQLVNQTGLAPSWSPEGDVFVTQADDGSTLIERPTEGVSLAIEELPWPARFDETGALVYSPAAPWLQPGRTETVVADAETGEVLERWGGEPQSYPFPARGVMQAPAGPAAALDNAEDCEGVTVYHPALDEPRCLPQAGGAAFAPDGSAVAYAVRIGGPSPFDAGRWPWDIVLLDIASGDEQGLAVNAASVVPPLIQWNEDGTHLLVSWPGPQGV